MDLNLFDVAVLITLGLSALLSFFRGFVREVLSLGGWLIASVVTLRFIEPVAHWIKPQVKSEMIASGIAAVGLFFVTLIVLSIVANMIVKFLKPGDKIGLLDNLAGLVFGAARGALIVSIAFFIFSIVVVEKNQPELVRKAYTRPYVERAAKAIAALTPDYLNKITKRGKEEARDAKDAAAEKIRTLSDKAESAGESSLEDIPSIEDLQQRIKEENEQQHVR